MKQGGSHTAHYLTFITSANEVMVSHIHVCWLVGWLLGWLVGCLVGLLVGWLGGLSAGLHKKLEWRTGISPEKTLFILVQIQMKRRVH